MRCKIINKNFNQVSFVVTIHYTILFNTYYTSSEKILYSSISHSPKYNLGYRSVYSIYKTANIGFFLENFANLMIV